MKNAIRALVVTCLVLHLACVPVLAEGVNAVASESSIASVETSPETETQESVEVEDTVQDNDTIESSDVVTGNGTTDGGDIVEGDGTTEDGDVVEDDGTTEGGDVVEGDGTTEGGDVVEGDGTTEGGDVVEGDGTTEGGDVAEGDGTTDGGDIVEGDSTTEGSDIVEGDGTTEDGDVVEDDSTTESGDVVEDDSTTESGDVVEDDSMTESGDVVEGDGETAEDDNTKEDSIVEDEGAAESDSTIESDSALENDSDEIDGVIQDESTSENEKQKEEELSLESVALFAEPKVADGWDSTGTKYYLNGKPVTGWLVTGGQRYWFDGSGNLVKDTWFAKDGSIYYAKPDGKIARGWLGSGANTFYFNDDGKQQKSWVVTGGERYWFGDNGRLVRNQWFPQAGSMYLAKADGKIARGWYNAGGDSFYFNNDGKQQLNYWVVTGGERYHFGSDGRLTKNAWFAQDGSVYLAKTDGKIVRGWYGSGNNTFYFNNDGKQQKAWVVTGGERYWFGDNGRLVRNKWFPVGGYTYLSKPDGKVVRGWYGSGDNTFYFNNDGQQQKAWVVTGGERYWFGDNGRLVRSKWFDVNNNSYYAKATGACARGWVTIGGIQYEFNNDGVYLGNVKNPEGVLGIDVSKHQGPIDWAKVRASGIQFAIIRALGWSSASNYYEVDPYFHTNMQGALNAGIPVGAYLYSYAFSEAEMLEEINFILPALNQWKNSFTYPIYIDYEDKLIWEKTQSNEQRTNILRTGMNALAQNGYLPGFYTYYNAATTYINTQQLIDEGYDFWVAHYGVNSNPWSGAGMWQSSSKGTVSGINGNVDLNYAYVDYPALSKTVTVYDVNTGKNVQGKIKDLVPQMVQNEVGGGLGLTGKDKASLFKAQTLAARSYLQFHTSNGLVPTVGLRTPSAEVLSNSNQVMRLGIYYNNSVINAAYGSCAGAYTNSAQNMGWGNYPYLASVESPYDKELAPQFYPKVNTISTQTMKNNIIKMVGQAQFNLYANDMSKWITAVRVDSHGNITGADVCGVSISGAKFYENCWGLYGANINSWKYNGNGTWTFSSNGNGHGVGLSQYGAAAYIAKGQSWRWVLNHYYPGTVVA